MQANADGRAGRDNQQYYGRVLWETLHSQPAGGGRYMSS